MKTVRILAVIVLTVVLSSTASTLAATAYNDAVLASNPTYYWTFDEPGIVDAEEQVNGDPLDVFIPGLDADPKIASTKTAGGVSLGLALDIFGLEPDKLWDAGDLSGDPFEGAWAYEIWINSNDPESYQYIMGSGASNGYNMNTILQFPYNGERPTIQIFDWGGLSDKNDVPLQTAGWHHWVFVALDAFTMEYDVYQDGVFLMTALTSPNPDADLQPFPARELRAGGWNTAGSVENFTGQIDEFAIYDLNGVEDLSAAGQAIARHYSVGATVPVRGDYNNSGVLDAGDLDLQAAAMVAGGPAAIYDLNNDNLVSLLDRLIWLHDLKKTWVGDSNLDDLFTSDDFVLAFQAGKYEVQGANATWVQGDWNGDQFFTSADFVAAFADGGYEAGPRAAVSAVPEPGSIGLALIGLLGLAGRLARRR